LREDNLKKFLIAAGLTTLVAAGAGLRVSQASPGPNGSNNHGLCTAYFNGSQNGQDHKHNAPPFQALEQAASDSGQSVADYCDGMVGGRAGREG